MQIIEVKNKRDWKLFHQVPHHVYRNDPNWICPLEKDIDGIFSPKKNKVLLNGAYKCFVLLDEQQMPAGRIAAFISFAPPEKIDHIGGGIGFFECIDCEEYAFALFKKAEEFLAAHNVQVIDGPINFGERDKFWGLLVTGFKPPLYQENFHPPYYRGFFERWGFQPYEQILTFRGTVSEVPFGRFEAIAERACQRYGFSAVHPDIRNLGKFARDFTEIYNASFRHSPYFKPLNAAVVAQLFKATRPIIDPNIMVFAYHNDQPVGFCIMLPEVNPFFQPFKGRMNFWKGLRFLYRLKTAKTKNIKGIVFGIHPDFHKKGIYSVMVEKMYKNPKLHDRYQYFYLATIRSYNQIMVKSTSNLGVMIDRIHYTYRKVIDPNVTFQPFEFVPEPNLS